MSDPISHPAPPAPESGEEPTNDELFDLACAIVDHWNPSTSEAVQLGPVAAPVGEIAKLVDSLQFRRAATLLQQLSAPAPVVVPVAVSDALIKAECALSDVAEGQPECDDGDPAQWSEQRCAETLAIIRPVMKRHKIRTSEWPPQPLPQAGEVGA